MPQKSIGCDRQCDLVVDAPGVAPVHALVNLATGGRIMVSDRGSETGLWLSRQGRTVQVKKVCLSIGDRIRVGKTEIALSQLSQLFELEEGARLMSAPDGAPEPYPETGASESSQAASLRRNPETGQIVS
jgi:pSer/pThr/pTyr-binding forkhead associated (FHA) protein